MSEPLRNFIYAERERFRIEDNNLFAFSVGQINRYREFMRIIEPRYARASRELVANSKALHAAVPSGDRSLTAEQSKLLDEGHLLTLQLHLEIESFYLFSKILLDKVAHAIEFYFGSVRRRPLDSHDDLVKHFAPYAADRRLDVPNDMDQRAASLKKDISDFRDYEIAHEKSPRRISGTGFSPDGRTTMISTMIYPSEKDQQASSRFIDDLSREIDEYLELFIRLIQMNRERTRLKLKDEPRSRIV